VKVGFTVESGVHRLGDEKIVGTVDSRLKVVTRLARSQRGTRRFGVVLDQHDGPLAGSPVREQSPDVVLTLGVVAVTPVFVEESVLNVDDNENGGTVHGNDLSIPDGVGLLDNEEDADDNHRTSGAF
jgi:hypothetical protein